jgi:hypothetical protein
MSVLVFWVVMPCGLVGGCQHFEGMLVTQKTMIYIVYNMFVLGLGRIIKHKCFMWLHVTEVQMCCHGIV